jgi:hypothetical protein
MAERIVDITTPLGDRLDELDKALTQFNRDTRAQLRARLELLGLKAQVERRASASLQQRLHDSVGAAKRKRSGSIDGVNISFVRHGIFVERGVGKNRPVGSDSANAAKKEWLFPILSGRVEALADLLEQHYADVAAEQVRLLIPGIIDITSKISK